MTAGKRVKSWFQPGDEDMGFAEHDAGQPFVPAVDQDKGVEMPVAVWAREGLCVAKLQQLSICDVDVTDGHTVAAGRTDGKHVHVRGTHNGTARYGQMPVGREAHAAKLRIWR